MTLIFNIRWRCFNRAIVYCLVLAPWFAWPAGAPAQSHLLEPTGRTPQKVTAAVPKHWPPQYQVDENGKPFGFAIDVMDEVAARVGLEVSYKVTDGFAAAAGALSRGEVDLVPNSGIVPERLKKYAFTSPVETFVVSLFVRDDTQDIDGVGDLAGRKLAVVETNIGQIMFKDRPDIDLHVFGDVRTALYELIAGQVDALVYPRPVILSLLQDAGLEDRVKVAGPPLREIKRGIQLRKDRKELLALLEKGVQDYVGTPGYQETYEKWFGRPKPFWTARRTAWAAGGMMVATVLILLAWRYAGIVKLNRKIRRSQDQFQDAIENISEGFVLFDAAGRLIACNDRYKHFYDYADEEVAPGVHKRDLAALDAERGTVILEDGSGQYPDGRIFAATAPPATIVRLGNGRVLECRDRKTSSGGVVATHADVTERETAKINLELANRRMALAADSAGIGIWDLDLVNDKLVWDDWMFRLHGLTPQAFAGTYEAWRQMVHPDDRPRADDELRDAVRGAANFNTEFRIVRPNGEIRHIKADAIVVRDDEGVALHLIGTNFDITERKNFEAELRSARDDLEIKVRERTRELEDSEARFRDIAESSSDWFWEMGPDLRFTYFTESYRDIVGVDSETLIGRRWPELLAEIGDSEVSEKHFDDLANHQRFRNFQYQTRRPDGTSQFITISGKPMFDQNGAFRGYRGTGSNITDRKQAEEKLRKLSLAVEQSPNAIFITDTDGKIEYVNSKFSEMTGFAGVEAIGENPRIFKSGETPAETYADLWNTIQKGDVWRGEVQDRRKDGACFWVDETIAPLKTESGRVTHYIATHEDISERKQAEHELRQAKEQAEVANLAKSEFLSSMSHELRTPLNAILGFAQLLETSETTPLTERQKKQVWHIKNGGEHLLGLVNEVLDLAKIEAGELGLSMETIDARELIVECLSFASTLAEKRGLVIEDHGGSPLPALWADRLRAKQAILNLLSNAVKYNRENGKVRLAAEARSSGVLRISVTDTGMGIAEEKQSELFQPFSRLGAELTDVEGTGIGLVLTKRLVEEMNGTMGFESTPGEGSTFWIDFPVSDEAGALERHGGPVGAGPGLDIEGETRLLLYVEDNPANLALMQAVIEDLPKLDMISAHTAELGLALAEKRRPDVIILDVNLPGMDGIEAVRQLKKTGATTDIPVLALSADAMPGAIQRGRDAGFEDYLTKPIEVAALMQALRDALAVEA